jgi:hypothetical protein
MIAYTDHQTQNIPSLHYDTPDDTPDDNQQPKSHNPFSSIHRLSSSSSTRDASETSSIMTGPPPYSAATTFQPSVHFQIETPGKALLSFPLPLRPDPIPIFSLSPGTSTSDPTPRFLSLRPARKSGNCFLVPAPPYAQAENEEPLHHPLSITTYRFGPGRPPRVRLFLPGVAPATANPFLDDPSDSRGEDGHGESGGEDVDLATWDAFEVKSLGLLTRAVGFRSRLGSFEWRYADRKERKAAGADSLLVLDRVVKVARAQNLGASSAAKEEEVVRTPVARLVRNAESRAQGSGSCSAGNGGRLEVDLTLWGEGEEKRERDMAAVMAVTTCLVMLKREVDRRRAQQIAIMAGAGSGGP